MRGKAIAIATGLALCQLAWAMPPRPEINEPAKLKEARAQGRIDNPAQGFVAQQTAKGGLAKVSGNRKYPVVLGYFSDLGSINSQAEFQSMLFGSTPGVKSVNNYFRDMSYSAMSCSGSVAAWVSAGNTVAYFGDSTNGLTNATTRNAYEFIRNVLTACDAGVNFADSVYDLDHDGYVDVLWVVHSGKGGEEVTTVNEIWSHSSRLTNWYGGSYFVTNDISPWTGTNVRINQYIIMPERTNYADGIGGTTEMIGCGVFCHEFGHALGLPDLYDTGTNPSISGSGLGLFSLMAAGSWGGDYMTSARPVSMDVWSKRFLGWLAPTLISQTGDYSIRSTIEEQNGSSYKLAALGMDNTTQYWLLENRYRLARGTNSGVAWDSLLLGQGLGIYHIDSTYTSGTFFSNNAVNCNSTNNTSRNRPYGVAMEETDMTSAGYTSELWLGSNLGESADLWNSVTQNVFSYLGSDYPLTYLNDGMTSTGTSVSSISAAGDTMYFSAAPFGDFVIGLLQNPAFLQYLTIAAVANSDTGLLRPNAIDTALMLNPGGTADLPFTRIGTSLSYQVNYELQIAGTHTIHLAAQEKDSSWKKADRQFEVVAGKASGGTVQALGGSISLSLASGALPGDILLAVFGVAEPPAQTAEALSPAVQIGPCMPLGEASQVSFRIDRAVLGQRDPERLGIYLADGGAWRYLGGVLDYNDGRVIAEIDRLGVYQLAWNSGNPLLPSLGAEPSSRAWPNPFRQITTVKYQITKPGDVSLKVYNAAGQLVRAVDQGPQPAGLHRISWDGTDGSGRQVSSGVYFYRLIAGDAVDNGRMVKVR